MARKAGKSQWKHDMFETEEADFLKENLSHVPAELVKLIGDRLDSTLMIVASEQQGITLLQHALAETDATSILVLYDPAQYAVARGMDNCLPPSPSLAAWKDDAAKLLSLYRKYRHRIVLVSLAVAQSEPERFWSKVAEHFKITTGEEAAASLQPCAPPWKDWHAILAHQVVATDAAAQALDMELEAAALPLALKNFDSDSIFAEISELTIGQRSAKSEPHTLYAADAAAWKQHPENERELLLGQLSELQAILITNKRTISEQQDIIAKVRDEAKAAGRLVISLQSKLVDDEIKRSSSKNSALSAINMSAHIGQTVHALLNNRAWNSLPALLSQRWRIRILKASGLVDPVWYLEYHKDVANANVDPLKHYMEHGAREGRPPNASYL